MVNIRYFPCDSAVKNLPAKCKDARNMSLSTRSGRSPGVGNTCLENSLDRGASWVRVHGLSHKEIYRTEQLSTNACMINIAKIFFILLYNFSFPQAKYGISYCMTRLPSFVVQLLNFSLFRWQGKISFSELLLLIVLFLNDHCILLSGIYLF